MLAEDTGEGDITTSLIVPADARAQATVIAKQVGIVAGIEEVNIFLQSLGLEVEASVNDGKKVRPGEVLLKISGDARTLLTAERTVLNLLSRMSGIATATRNLVEKLQKAHVKTRVACTRKTAPGLLYFDKKAVMIGGGDTHRLHLDDMILIKDNHVALAGSVEKAVEKARKHASFSKKIEVEVTKTEELLPAVRAGADIIMLDNFSPKQVQKAMTLLKKEKHYGKVMVEASGGITAENIMRFASTGVDVISLGEITQSPKALDLSLKIKK
jgi:nicotinate-nucleotide pyrophosphorylase (carboxylating)